MKTLFNLCIVAAAGSILTGCGGGNKSQQAQPPISYVPLVAPGSAEVSPISGGSVDTVSGAITTASGGSYDRSDNSYSLGGDSGTIDFAGGAGSINGGGSLSVFGLETYVSGLTAQPAGGNTLIGYVGVHSDTAAMGNAPATATFNGASKVVANDGSAIWTLDGTSTVSMDFLAGSGSGSIGNLNGTRADLSGGTTAVSNVATLGLNNLVINGNQFSSNTVAVTSNQLATLGGPGTVSSVQGGFYGPAAMNVGGVLSVDDTASGSLAIQGAFTGTR